MKKIKPRPTAKQAAIPVHGGTSYTGEAPTGEPGEPTEDAARVRTGRADSLPAVREDERGVLADWMCGAKLRGERTGLLCRNPRMKGRLRCRMHGSATLLSREKAADLIIASTYPAVRKLRSIINDPKAPYSAVIAACRDLLDRADLAGTTKVEIEAPAFQRDVREAMNVTMRRTRSDDDQPAITGDADIVDAEVVPEDAAPEWQAKLAAKVAEPVRPRATPVREEWVSSSDVPPRHVAQRTPGYQPTGGTRRTPTRMTR